MANVPKNTWYDARGSRAHSHLLSTLFYAVYRYNAGRLGAARCSWPMRGRSTRLLVSEQMAGEIVSSSDSSYVVPLVTEALIGWYGTPLDLRNVRTITGFTAFNPNSDTVLGKRSRA